MNSIAAAANENKVQEALEKVSRLKAFTLSSEAMSKMDDVLNKLNTIGVFAPPYGDVWIKTLQIRRTSSAYISARDKPLDSKEAVFMETKTGGAAIGYCRYLGHSTGLLITWDGNRVVEVDCDHAKCGYASSCDLYQRHPVGYEESCPLAGARPDQPDTGP